MNECCSRVHFRCHSYTYPFLHYSPTRLLQLTLCWQPGFTVARLQYIDRVLRSAARLPVHIPKFGHVSSYMLDVLRWLPLQQRISYRIISLVWRSLLGLASAYRQGLCCPTMGIPDRRSLRSAERCFLIVRFAPTTTRQNRAFSVVGP